ncbi:MAG: hypothetical protein QOI10_4213, partial [Solirubrobacterales bacterium]|nr:hypothetical protein [Solirubrobacterales bacterium]
MVVVFVAAAVGAVVVAGVASRPEGSPRASASGAAALGRLQGLPLQAQSVISARLGAGSAAFAARPSGEGYRLAGGGVAAEAARGGVRMDVNGGSLSMVLSGVGRAGRLRSPGAVSPRARSNRVSFARPNVSEWYAAGPLGIEQGFTLASRPSGAAGSLTLALRLGGSLRATPGGSGVRFVAPSGRVAARYGGLVAVDARGRRLPAALALIGGSLRLRVDDRGARYPVRIDPFVQQGPKLTGGDGEFGRSVALSADGDTALIGADVDSADVGAAWVFTRSAGVWTQQGPKLTGGGETGAGHFGMSVALSADGDTALIGGPVDNSGLGAAWVFTRSGGVWNQQGLKLTGSGETGQGWFGRSVALSADGDTALMGGQFDNSQLGAAWAFTRSAGTWNQQGPKLTGASVTINAFFGTSVALSSDGNTGLVGGSGDHAGIGAAWVFTRSAGAWTQQGPKLTGSSESGAAVFGLSVALSADGDTGLVGAPFDNSGLGAAWVFTRSGGAWSQQGSKLTGSDETGAGSFGAGV